MTITQPTKANITQTACNSYNWHGNTYNISGNYTFDSLNAAGCDSLTTLSLTITQPTKATITQTACNSYNWHGNTYNISGNYTFDSLNTAGCDSLTTLSLTILNPSPSITQGTICEGGSYLFNGLSYTKAGTYNTHITTKAGCDSVATLVLTINPPTSSITNSAICPGGAFVFNDSTYSSAGTYATHLTNNAGCDSIAKLILTINPTSTSTTNATICAGNFYEFNGINYDTSGIYTSHLTTKAGCDSIATLVLVVDSLDLPFPIAGSNQVCQGDTIVVTDLTPNGTWTTLTPSIASVDNKGVVTGLDTGIATIQYNVSLMCGTESVKKNIPILGIKPKVVPTTKDATCLDEAAGTIKLSIIGSEGPYQFSFDGGMYDTAYVIPNLQVGSYSIIIYNSATCPVDTSNVQIALDPDQSCDTLYVPTAFVPTSNETNNRILKPFGGGSSIQSITFKVFNRYGSVVFESHDLNTGWDGTINGTIQDTGTYIWYLDYTQNNNKIRHSRGTSVLIR